MTDSEAKNMWVRETTDATFEEDVIERSREIPIVLDFWADWCAPCRMLGPVLEKLADEYQGRFDLVKANTEQVPHAAQRFAVQSIPVVYGIRDGEVRDYFMGALPEQQIRDWLGRLLPSPAEILLSEAESLADSDPIAAEAKFRESADLDRNLVAAKIGLARLMLAHKRFDESSAIIVSLEERGFLEPEGQKVKSAIDRQNKGTQAGDLEACRQEVLQMPGDHALRLKLAEALAAAGNYEEALEEALCVVQADRVSFGDAARTIMVDIFHLLPDDSDLTRDFRRKLSSALY